MAPSLGMPTLVAMFVLALMVAHRFGPPSGRGPI